LFISNLETPKESGLIRCSQKQAQDQTIEEGEISDGSQEKGGKKEGWGQGEREGEIVKRFAKAQYCNFSYNNPASYPDFLLSVPYSIARNFIVMRTSLVVLRLFPLSIFGLC